MTSRCISRIVLTLAFILCANTLEAQVKLRQGPLQGKTTPDGKVIAYKGIPYGQAPVGKLRWQPPLPAAPWTGTRSAVAFGNRCVQSATYNDMVFHDSALARTA